jgi:flagellar biosynthesis/type III secretory pathway protein FliH
MNKKTKESFLSTHKDLPEDVSKYIKSLENKLEKQSGKIQTFEETTQGFWKRLKEERDHSFQNGVEAGKSELGVEDPVVVAFIRAYTSQKEEFNSKIENLQSEIESLKSDIRRIDRKLLPSDRWDE